MIKSEQLGMPIVHFFALKNLKFLKNVKITKKISKNYCNLKNVILQSNCKWSKVEQSGTKS